LAQCGYKVEAVDIASAALAIARRRAKKKRVNIEWIEADLDSYNMPKKRYDLITISYYLNRDIVPRIKESLKPRSFLFYEQHASMPGELGQKNWLLKPNELLRLFEDLRIRYFEEVPERYGGIVRSIQRLVAQKPPALYELPETRSRQ
jgi:tellurite methyltransferase